MDLCEYTGNEKRHPWELSRASQILNIMKHIEFNKEQELHIADIGAGDLYFDSLLFHISDSMSIDALDTEFSSLSSDHPKLSKYKELSSLVDYKYDFIIMMDVLEHIKDDRHFISQIQNKMSDNTQSYLLITVPAFSSLYSAHDAFLKHFRRYDKKQLTELITNHTELQIIDAHYFYFSLFIIRSLQKHIKKKSNEQIGIGAWKYSGGHIITRCMKAVLDIDFIICRCLNRCGIALPGLSLFMLCGKKKK